MGQGSFSADIHNPCPPCAECSQRNVNEVHFERYGRGPRQRDTLNRALGDFTVAFDSAVLSPRHRPHSKGVAVSQLTR